MSASILWVDDEIDLLKPHILFLKEKGYDVDTATSGAEALDIIEDQGFDIIFLDENMPGLTGVETLERIKSKFPALPVVMITKSEEETIMNSAIGSNISDYLIKPVNPHQILLALKKNLENRKLISEKTSMAYQQQFREIGASLSVSLEFSEWVDIYKQLVYWELELSKSQNESLRDIFLMQKGEANSVFARFIKENYTDWLNGRADEKPVLSHTAFREKCHPIIKKQEKVFLIIIDNLRFDQWKAIRPRLEEIYRVVHEDIYCSILPTATQYARNSFFAGLLPGEIQKMYPKYWTKETEEGKRNEFEQELFAEQLQRLGGGIPFTYHKILNLSAGKKLLNTLSDHASKKLNVLVYNFVDMLSHSRTEMEVIKELADDEAAYRSLTVSWFDHSPLWEIIRQLAEWKIPVIITTDHGSVRVHNPTRVVGDKNTNTNLRYKTGKNLQYDAREVFEIRNPADAFLPKDFVSANFIFALEDNFFAYPNNYNYYVSYYKNTFQHGGVSLDEMLIPFIYLTPK
ncbi:MAG: bifunctional response regulator/alkaline phosphatase family protein [Bacteroidales bacterium]|nr:bifunctional response regulator/alkaline phosphatase family protein [Bacteroidales bacterium]